MSELLLRLRLSIAELDLLARAAGLDAFPGLPTDVADPSSDTLLIDSLRARGILDEELTLRADVATLLAAIVECDVSLELETIGPDGEAGAIIHLRDELAFLQVLDDGLVSLTAMPLAELPAFVTSMCGEPGDDDDGATDSVTVTRDQLRAAELGNGSATAQLTAYVTSVTAPARAGRAAARGTMYGEVRTSCAWFAGAGGTFVVLDHGDDAEVVRCGGRQLAAQLLGLAGSAT